MRSEDLEKQIDDVLLRSQVWEPPADFARTVSAQAGSLLARELVARESFAPLMSGRIIRAARLGVLVAATAYLAQVVVLAPMAEWLISERAVAVRDAYLGFIMQASEESAIPIAWISMAITLAVSAWFTRGIRPFSSRLR